MLLRFQFVSAIALLLFSVFAKAQDSTVAQLKSQLAKHADDTAKVNMIYRMADRWMYGSKADPGKIVEWCNEGIRLSDRLGYVEGKGRVYIGLGTTYILMNEARKAEDAFNTSIRLLQSINNAKGLAYAYFNLAFAKWQQNETKKALELFRQAAVRSHESDNVKLEGQSYLNAAICLHAAHEMDSATGYYYKALEVQKKIGDSILLGNTLTQLALLYSDRGEKSKAIEKYYEAAALLERSGNVDDHINAVVEIGNLFLSMEDYANAKKYLFQAKDLVDKYQGSSFVADAYLHVGQWYLAQGDKQAARTHLSKALHAAEKGDAGHVHAVILAALGDCEQGRSAAKQWYERALLKAREYDDKRMVASVLNKVAGVKVDMKDTVGIAALLNEAITECLAAGNINQLKNAYFNYARYYEVRNEPSLALGYYKRYNTMADSFYHVSVAEKLSEANAKYDAQNREAKILSLTQQQNIDDLKLRERDYLVQKRNFQFIAITFIFIVFTVIGILWYSRQKQVRKKEIAEMQYRERLRIADDMHDDIGSGLSRISMMAQLAGTTGADEGRHTMHEIATVSRELVDNMRHLIWMLNPGNNTLAELAVRLREFCADYIDERSYELRLDFPDDVPDMQLNENGLRNIFLVVKESVHNILKHADAHQVDVQFLLDTQTLQLVVKDDGKGFDPTASKKGNGLRTMQDRIRAVGGSYLLESVPGDGTCVTIEVPLASLQEGAKKEIGTFVG